MTRTKSLEKRATKKARTSPRGGQDKKQRMKTAKCPQPAVQDPSSLDRNIPGRYPLIAIVLVGVSIVVLLLVGERVLNGLYQWQRAQPLGQSGDSGVPLALVVAIYVMALIALWSAVRLPRQSNDLLSRSCAIFAFILLVVAVVLFSLLLVSPLGYVALN